MSAQLTQNLVIKAKNGDAQAFGELYGIYADDMYRFAFYYTSSKTAAEDAVGDAVLYAFSKIRQLKKDDSFKPWLFKILFNCCKKSQKEKAVAKRHIELSQAKELAAQDKDYIENLSLARALGALSDEERQIIVLSFACGYKSEEIAEMTGIKSSTVRSKLSRACVKLRTRMLEERI